ncbi:maleylpyruvate isomerase N-terminal domain-containing protein [Propionicicella superfundia]|uniref:maleylpyruvate isomerase N-terminal domain-containing protein n=1 Tax=Propionicicella superfundia TaxID=348582 RepID=UPI00041D247B|nr:maleylpyruvate isomerase N-terminal domain-containing protein [Propionicicella superfundia]
MGTSEWNSVRRAFADAAGWFCEATTWIDDRWEAPALGEWDVRALVGHTSRALLTVEQYAARPAVAVEIPTATAYYVAARRAAGGHEVARRGRVAGEALGVDPAGTVGAAARRVVGLVDAMTGDEFVACLLGGMRLIDYLPTRTFELVVHTVDLCDALGVEAQVPPVAAGAAVRLAADLAVDGGTAAPVLRALTGRAGLSTEFTVL